MFTLLSFLITLSGIAFLVSGLLSYIVPSLPTPSFLRGIKAIAIGVLLSLGSYLNPFVYNTSGYQTFAETISGQQRVISDAGLSFVGPIITDTEVYPNVITTSFSIMEKDNVTHLSSPFEIRFNDATRATAEATVRWQLPKDEASTRESISKQKLITAQQEALTAKEEGAKLIAETRATEEAAKLQAVIRSEKEKEVSQQQALQAGFIAEKIKQEGRAKAEANKALVIAGLTPQQQMERDIKIADVVSKNISSAPTPQVVMMGGASGSQSATSEVMNVFGAERALSLIERMNKKK